jgi:hypothetical protein
MKTLLIAVMLFGPIYTVHAQTTTTTSTTTSNNGANSNSAGGNQGQSLSIDNHSLVEGTSIPVATAVAPQLVASYDACMGSSSAGIQGASFGVSVGGTWKDENCIMRKDATLLFNIGLKNAALARLCQDPKNRDAIETGGTICPTRDERISANTTPAKSEPDTSNAATYNKDDPIITERMRN